jgi:parallel beta-helix repeat protein
VGEFNNNTISGNVLNDHQHGIYIAGSYNEILDNTIYGAGTGSGIVIQGTYTNNRITGNTIENCWQGMFISGADNNTISDNTALKNLQYGIALTVGADDNDLSENIVFNNTLSGIIIESSTDNTVEGSLAEANNAHGIYLMNGDNNVIHDNEIRNNIQDGISIATGSANNLFYGNFFWGNARHAFDDGVNNDWNSTTIGNYWDNHTGPDTSPVDGIVDTPYSFIEGGAGSIDYLPIAEDGPPSIVINSPFEDDIFDSNAPSFSVTITDNFLDDQWYSIDGGLHNYTFNGSTGTIDPSAWDALPDGLITLTFYASDYADNIGSAEVNIEKDSQVPLIIINSPHTDDIFGASAPNFIVEITDDNLDSMWYSLDGGTTSFLFTVNGTIDQTVWAALSEGFVTITFYANDTAGNIASETVNVEKSLPPPGDNLIIIITVITIVAGVAIVTVVIVILRRKGRAE